MGLGGGAAQNNANQDQGDFNAIVSRFFSQVAPGYTALLDTGGTNANMTSAANTLEGIASGNTQAGQIQTLSNTFNNANQSGLKTLMSRLGGTANPNLLAKDISSQNAMSGMQNTQALQSGITGQEISAASGLGSLGESQFGNLLSGLGGYSSGLSGLGGAAQQNEAYNQNLATQQQQSNLGLFSSLLGGLVSAGLFGGLGGGGAGGILFPGSSTSSTLP